MILLRKTGLDISFLLFPLTIYYLSPTLIIIGTSEGIGDWKLYGFRGNVH